MPEGTPDGGVGVSIRLDDRVHWLALGDVIGRHHRCALVLEDDRISEAHAMLSLRGAGLHLLNLRGGLRALGRPVHDPQLSIGTRLEIAAGLELEVGDVALPDRLWVLTGPGLDTPLERRCSLVLAPRPHLVAGTRPRAVASFWFDGRRWYRAGDGPLADGAPVVRGDVHALQITGVAVRILHELAEIRAPVDWLTVARMVWPEGDEHQLRRRWDKTLSRLRVQLRQAAVRDDLIRPSGRGLVELVVNTGDEVRCRG